MSVRRALVAGIGNVFMGDDGFGVAVAQRLAARPLPEGVVVMDVGIRGLDLTYALMEGYDVAILVDVTRRGGAPGTLYVIDPDGAPVAGEASEPALVDAHGMDPMRVLDFVRRSGVPLGTLALIGCEPAYLGSADGEPEVGLSAPVEAAVPGAIELILALLATHECDRPTPGDSNALPSLRHA